MSRLKIVFDRIRFARRYTLGLLDDVKLADWFRQPSEGVTHIGWQVGHLAFAQYRLALERIRGRRPDDDSLIPGEFFTLFGRDSVPSPDPSVYPPPQDIRAVFDRMHARTLSEIDHLPDDELDKPPVVPHRLYNTKIDSLHWCVEHEMLHAGQIGLLRRLLDYEPQW